jgi:hypothetical protein
MGTQNRAARMPARPATVAPRPYPILWDTRAHMMALDARKTRELFGEISGGDLIRVLDAFRPHVAETYINLRNYRAALHEAVVMRHWTVEWSESDNRHKIY